MRETLLYIYKNDVLKQVYVGIGGSPERIWGRHNEDAERLRDHPNTEFYVTKEPFPDQPSAERAESAAIFAASAAGLTVLSESGDLDQTTNRAKVHGSKHMVPVLFQREGTVRYDELRKTVLVVLKLSSIGEHHEGTFRPTLNASRSDAEFHYRATRWWGLAAAQKRRMRLPLDPEGSIPRDVNRLIAVQKGGGLVLGAWDLSDQQWYYDDLTRKGWIFDTADSASPDTADMRGKVFDWCGAGCGTQVTWSSDIRETL